MKLQLYTVLTGAIMALLFFFPPLSPASNGASTTLQVSAVVLPWLHLSAEQHTTAITIDETDLQRGYLDLLAPLEIVWQANGRRCIDLTILTAQEADRPQADQRLLCLPLPDHPRKIMRQSLDLRLPLTHFSTPGRYPLILSIISTLTDL